MKNSRKNTGTNYGQKSGKNTTNKAKKSLWTTFVMLVVIVLYVLFGQDAGTEVSVGSRVAAEFVRVVDGDTIIIKYDDKETRVRLIGINAPESVHEDETKNTQEGRDASAFLKDYLENVQTVWLEFDIEQYDQYERMLAYVWMSGDGTDVAEDMLNGIIVNSGHAEARSYEPNVKYDQELQSLNH